MSAHQHAVASTGEVRGYTRSVGTRRTGQEPRANGGITVTERCVCGASRLVNRNGGYEEHGEWTAPITHRGHVLRVEYPGDGVVRAVALTPFAGRPIDDTWSTSSSADLATGAARRKLDRVLDELAARREGQS